MYFQQEGYLCWKRSLGTLTLKPGKWTKFVDSVDDHVRSIVDISDLRPFKKTQKA